MTRFFSLCLLVVTIGFAGNAAALEPCAKDYTPIAERYKTGIAFIVQKCGGLQSVVIGTMHSDDPRLVQMHQKSLPVIKVARTALFEIKFDNDAIQKTLAAMFYNPASGKSLKSEAGAELYERFMKVATEKDQSTDYLKPWAAAVMLQYPKKVADGVELDLKLQNLANQQGVNVAGLEKVEEQLGIFDSLPLAAQVQALKDVLDNYDYNLKMQDRLRDAYLAKDLKALEALIPESIALSSDKAEAEALMKLLIDDRNIRMADRLVPYLELGNSFTAIGALHLPGKIGVLKLLEDKGYRIEVLY